MAKAISQITEFKVLLRTVPVVLARSFWRFPTPLKARAQIGSSQTVHGAGDCPLAERLDCDRNEQDQQNSQWGAAKPIEGFFHSEVHSDADSNEFLTQNALQIRSFAELLGQDMAIGASHALRSGSDHVANTNSERHLRTVRCCVRSSRANFSFKSTRNNGRRFWHCFTLCNRASFTAVGN
jgi:hypothetical protein